MFHSEFLLIEVQKSRICARLWFGRSPHWEDRWEWAWVFRNPETLNLSILLTINIFSIRIMVPWFTTVDKNSNFIKMHDFQKTCFPCWKWPTQVEHSQQYVYNVWFKHILHIYNDYSYRVLTFIRLFVDKNTQISGIDMRLQSNRPKIMNLHASSIRLFWALTGPLAMSLSVSESWYCWIYVLRYIVQCSQSLD